MSYPKYVFLTYGTYETNWWIPPSDEDVQQECSPKNRVEVLQNSIAASNFQFIDENDADYLEELTDAGIVSGLYINVHE